MLCANTGWHRNHARKALKAALQPKVVTPRSPRPLKYGPDVIAALTVCWTVLERPAGKRLAPMLAELVAVLRRFGELDIDDVTAALLVAMSAATIEPAWPGASEDRRRDVPRPSRDRCSRVRSRCAPGPIGTRPDPGSWRSTWSATTAATRPDRTRSR